VGPAEPGGPAENEGLAAEAALFHRRVVRSCRGSVGLSQSFQFRRTLLISQAMDRMSLPIHRIFRATNLKSADYGA
jgi:hypothetical protein